MQFCKDNYILCEKTPISFGMDLFNSFKFIRKKDNAWNKSTKSYEQIYIINIKLLKEHFKVDELSSENVLEFSDSDG